MQFVQAPREELEAALAAELLEALKKGTVVWLLPGGSNIPSVVAVMERLKDNDNSRLTLLPADERYVDVDSSESYVTQFNQAGLNLYGANLAAVLSGAPREDTVMQYDHIASKLITESDKVVAFLGIGSNGLVASIIPGTPSVYAMKEWAIAYDLQGGVRLTLTPFALSHVDVAYIGAYGSEKGSILRSLKDDNTPILEQPCQLLKHIPRVFIYNDQVSSETEA